MLISGHLGVHPPGALGVAFFVHAKAECLVGQSGDGITEVIKEIGSLKLEQDGEVRLISLSRRIFGNLLEADAKGGLPELLFVCCNPNQIVDFVGGVVRFLENLAQRGMMSSVEDVRERMPILLILPNGILAEHTIDALAAQMNESRLMNRLLGVTDEVRAAIMDRVVRGISLQAGGRHGSGAETTYLLERKGEVVYAGGGAFEGERIAQILTEHDYPFTHVQGVPATRIEFDKAMISIVLNVGGLVHMVDPDGDCLDLRMGDLCSDPTKDRFVESITQALFDVGQAIGAYPPEAEYESIWAKHRATILKHKGHITSSVKGFSEAIERGLDSVKLFSNEEWLLTPLCHYAANSDLREEEQLFRDLGHEVQASMARAIMRRRSDHNGGGARRGNMKLIAQRNIDIELYEDGPETLLVIGTFHDSDHLIRLELTLHVPDEQITRSELQMIRIPFPVCSEVNEIADRLVGLRIEHGVAPEIGRRLGGQGGCLHVREIALSIAQFAGTYLVRRNAGVEPYSEAFLGEPPEARFRLTRDRLRDSCLAYSQLTAHGLDVDRGIRRIGDEHSSPVPLGEYEPSFGALVRDRVLRWGKRTHVRYRVGEEERELSWQDFGDKVTRIARNLIAQDVKPGDRISIISENRVEMYILELAIMSIGAVSVPIFAGYQSPLIGYVIRHARPRFVVASNTEQLEKIERDRHSFIERYYCIDFNETAGTWGALDFADLLADGGALNEELEARIDAVHPDDLCLIMYTSGTTGPPKGVRLSHRNLISQQKAISLIWEVDENDVFLSFLPWHHSFGGLFERFMTLYNGCVLGLDDSRGRDIDRIIDNWRRFKPTLFFSVPRVHDLLLTRCREDKSVADLVFDGRLRFVFTAGASLPAQVEASYRDNGVLVLEGWGLTETSPCACVTSPEKDWRSGYVGFPIPGVTVRVDSDQEILVRGPNVMQGYLEDEDATARVIDEDEWFHTGDLGEFTRSGLRILGRKDGAFKLTTGEKVHPQRVEITLVNESPYVGTALAVGSGKNYVATLIYPDFSRLRAWAEERGIRSTVLTDDPQVRELYAGEIARINPKIEVKYQRVRRAIVASRGPSLERGELTPSGKIVRQRVFDSFRHEIDKLFSIEPSDCVINILEPNLTAGDSKR